MRTRTKLLTIAAAIAGVASMAAIAEVDRTYYHATLELEPDGARLHGRAVPGRGSGRTGEQPGASRMLARVKRDDLHGGGSRYRLRTFPHVRSDGLVLELKPIAYLVMLPGETLEEVRARARNQ